MQNIISNLLNTPIPIDSWKDNQVGDENNGPYKHGYQSIKVNEFPRGVLTDVSHHGIVSSDFYLDELLKGDQWFAPAFNSGMFWARAFLRSEIAIRLSRVDQFLRSHGMFIFLVSGWRHPKIQELSMEKYAQTHGIEAAKRMFALADPNVAAAPHSTGAAMDIEIWSKESNSRLEMYYSHGGMQIYSAYKLEKMALENSEIFNDSKFFLALRNRRLLYHTMCSLGVVFEKTEDLFVGHPGEFWHFGSGDPLSAYLNKEKSAKYGLIYPELLRQS